MSNKKSMADLRARFKAKKEGKSNFNNNNDVYPHWNIPVDSTAVIRIIADLNEDNDDIFFVDKREHQLDINGKRRKIPCLEMYDEKCPICDLSRKFYKSEGDKSVNGKYYYRKVTHLLKGLILKDPIEDAESSEGQVKTLQFTWQIMKNITQQLSDDNEETALEEYPWDVDAGYNFNIKKDKQGEYDNYTSSGFARKVSAVPEQYMELATEGRIDLKTLLPENPGFDAVQALLEQHLGIEAEEVESKPAPRRARPVEAEVEAEDDDATTATLRRRAGRPAVEEEEAAPVTRTTRRVVEEADEVEEAPIRTRRVAAEVEEEEEAPVVRRRAAAVVEADEEEAPVVRRRAAAVVEADEEEEAAPRRTARSTRPAVAEVADADDEDEAVLTRIRRSVKES